MGEASSADTQTCPSFSQRRIVSYDARQSSCRLVLTRSAKLRELCDLWEKHGSGLTNMHGSTGDIILLGTNTANLQPCFDALTEAGSISEGRDQL